MEMIRKNTTTRSKKSKKSDDHHEQAIKVKYISSPVMVNARDASEFRQVVQQLTGRDSDLMMSAAAATTKSGHVSDGRVNSYATLGAIGTNGCDQNMFLNMNDIDATCNQLTEDDYLWTQISEFTDNWSLQEQDNQGHCKSKGLS